MITLLFITAGEALGNFRKVVTSLLIILSFPFVIFICLRAFKDREEKKLAKKLWEEFVLPFILLVAGMIGYNVYGVTSTTFLVIAFAFLTVGASLITLYLNASTFEQTD